MILQCAVLDLPPALTKLTEKVITLSDSVFVPIKLGTLAIQGIPAVTGALANCNENIEPNRNNFYDNSEIEALEVSEHNGKYELISGHRRLLYCFVVSRINPAQYWNNIVNIFEENV